MVNVDQRRQSSAGETIAAAEAIALLGIRKQTLSAYVSRGLVRRVPGAGKGARRYLGADVERLRSRQLPRSGEGPAAAGALRFAEPALESRSTAITAASPPYGRGPPAGCGGGGAPP